MTLVIRELLDTETSEWGQMRLRLWDDLSDEQNEREIAKALEDPNCTTFIALNGDDKPVGFAEVSIRDYANGCTEQPVPFLEGIWVDPDHQRHGIGRLMVDAIIAEMQNRGFRELCSDILEDNQQSYAAHEKWGFEETERVVYFRKSFEPGS